MEDTMRSKTRQKLLKTIGKFGSEYCLNAIEKYNGWRTGWAEREAKRRRAAKRNAKAKR